MAKLHNYYVLCPLLDQKSFLGVSQDKDENNIIVTLGRNVVNKYRLSDQKQVAGWTSKDHITSAVVYDHEQKTYAGVFNNNTIKLWTEDSENLDKVKKYKFPVSILKIIPRPGQSALIVFSNGNCASLPYAIDNRKTYEGKSFINKETQEIVDVSPYTLEGCNYICYMVKNKNDYEIITCPLRDELGDLEKSKLSKVKISRPDDVFVSGVLVSTNESGDKKTVYVLWSDSKMTAYDLAINCWKIIGTVPWISTTTRVSLAYMGNNNLILFGSNIEQDGAVIFAYHNVLGVGSCKYPMKMYSEDAQLNCYNGHIILEASNHIGILRYVLEPTRNLSSILGSHEIAEDEVTEIKSWDNPKNIEKMINKNHPFASMLKLGVTERQLCSQIIPPLLEKKNSLNVLKNVDRFEDVPESIIVRLLKYSVELVNSQKVDVTDHANFTEWCNYENKDDGDDQKKNFMLLNRVFELSFSDALLIPHLRNILNVDDTLLTMMYIMHLLTESNMAISKQYESNLLDWCTVLMDAFYQQFVMTKDQKVTYVLDKVLKSVNDFCQDIYEIDQVLPILHNFILGKGVKGANATDESFYNIELMQI